MTEGQRIAEEMDGVTRAETARRIDAALAGADARIVLLESYYCPEHTPSAPPPPLYLCEVCEREKVEAALAEVARERDQWREDARVRELNTRDANRELAEREAQIAALREALDNLAEEADALACAVRLPQESLGDDAETRAPAVSILCSRLFHGVLADTADAAARCLARARQEGAEEMRKRCISEIRAWDDSPCGTEIDDLIVAIRALDAGDPAARRG